MTLWNDLIPRLHRPREVADRRPTTSGPTTDGQQPSSRSPTPPPPTAEASTLAAMERDRGSRTKAMSAIGQDRKSDDRKSHNLQHDADVVGDAKGGNNNDNDVTVSFSLAVMVGCILLLLNVIVFVGTMCQWPRLRRRRRRQNKQRHAAALAALTSYPLALTSHPVDSRKLDGSTVSPLGAAGDATEETRLTLLCSDDHVPGVRACDSLPDCHCKRPDECMTNFCDGRCSSTVNVETETSLAPVHLTADTITQCNHVFSRNQFTAV